MTLGKKKTFKKNSRQDFILRTQALNVVQMKISWMGVSVCKKTDDMMIVCDTGFIFERLCLVHYPSNSGQQYSSLVIPLNVMRCGIEAIANFASSMLLVSFQLSS